MSQPTLRAARKTSTLALQRGITTSAPRRLPLPPRYGNGPLYRNKMSPKDAITQAEPSVLRMLMFGKPGSGKGTLSNKLVSKYDISQLSAGDILRSHILEQTEVGRLAEGLIAKGALVPDEIMTRVITSKLDSLRNRHWILDGFPRTVGQGQLLDAHLRHTSTPLTLIINLDVPDDVILSRINDRWVHLPSGRVYNTSYNAPRVPGVDDVTGEPLSKRPDDTPEVFKRRLQSFYDVTTPLLAYYSSAEARASTKMVTLTGRTSDEIWPQLDAIVSQEFRIKSKELLRKTSLQEAVLHTGTAGPLYDLVLGSKL